MRESVDGGCGVLPKLLCGMSIDAEPCPYCCASPSAWREKSYGERLIVGSHPLADVRMLIIIALRLRQAGRSAPDCEGKVAQTMFPNTPDGHER